MLGYTAIGYRGGDRLRLSVCASGWSSATAICRAGKPIALRRIAFVGWAGKRPPHFYLLTIHNGADRQPPAVAVGQLIAQPMAIADSRPDSRSPYS
jgi:hypothetical protein